MPEVRADQILQQAKDAGIADHPEVRPWLEAIATFPNESWLVEAAAQIVGHYSQKYITNPFAFRPEYLLATTNPQDGFLQGHCEGHEIYLPREQRKRSEMVVGKPGTGKSTYIAQQIQQAVEKNITTWLFDFKDEHGPLCEKLNILTLHLTDLKLNPHELLNEADAVECFSHANLFQNASIGYYRDALHKTLEIYKDSIPSVHHVRTIANLMSTSAKLPKELRIDPTRHQTLTARDRVLRALDDLLGPYGDIVDCEHGFPIEKLAHLHLRINCSGVAYKEASYLIYVLLKSLYNYRNRQRIQQKAFDMPLTNLIVIEEAKHVISSIMERGMLTAPAFIRKITTEVRSSGLGYIFSDQVPSDLAKSAIESCNTLTLFRVGLKDDLDTIGGAMGLSQEQQKLIYQLPDAVAVTKHGNKKPIRIEIPTRNF
jgi:hypothetical protein